MHYIIQRVIGKYFLDVEIKDYFISILYQFYILFAQQKVDIVMHKVVYAYSYSINTEIVYIYKIRYVIHKQLEWTHQK